VETKLLLGRDRSIRIPYILFLWFSPASSLLFSKEYKQNYRDFKLENLPERKKE
jgi:hypothetical protein